MGLWNLAADVSDEKDGRWFLFEGFRIKLARLGGSNTAYKKALERETADNRRAIELRAVGEDEYKTIMVRAFVVGCIRGWQTQNDKGEWLEGYEAEDGEIKPALASELVTLLMDPRFHDLWMRLQTRAMDEAAFRVRKLRDDAKN